eukprot:gene38015-46914_t
MVGVVVGQAAIPSASDYKVTGLDKFGLKDGSEAPAGTDPAAYYLKYNPYAWNEAAHVLFVEQPVRTGFSIAAMGVKEIKDEFQVATDFRNFFLSFITVFPQFKGMETFISGESYAGFYIPYIAEHIVNNQLVADIEDAGRSTDDLIVQKDPKIQPDPVPINESPPGR